jgi:hypothetical protein
MEGNARRWRITGGDVDGRDHKEHDDSDASPSDGRDVNGAAADTARDADHVDVARLCREQRGFVPGRRVSSEGPGARAWARGRVGVWACGAHACVAHWQDAVTAERTQGSNSRRNGWQQSSSGSWQLVCGACGSSAHPDLFSGEGGGKAGLTLVVDGDLPVIGTTRVLAKH